MEQKNTTKKPSPIPIKPLLYLVSLILLFASVTYGLIGVSAALPGGFSAEAILTTLRLIREMFLWPSIVFILIGIILAINGIVSRKTWFLGPTGIILISAYWLIMNIMTIKMVAQIFGK